MQKCYNIKTWEEQKSYNGLSATDHINVTISFDESYISFNSYTKIDQDFIHDSQDRLDRSGDYFYNTSKKIEQSTQTDPVLARLCRFDPVLARLCRFTGGKMYGDYVVFQDCDNNYTVFEEYSKHLRNEENKFEAINKLINF